MKYLLIAMLVLAIHTQAQKALFNATVTDDNGNVLIGALVLINNGEQSVVTNAQGRFQVMTSTNEQTLIEIRHIGFLSQRIIIDVNQSLPSSIALKPAVEMLREVTVTDNRATTIQRQHAHSTEVVNQSFLRTNQSGSLMASLERLPGVGAMSIGSGQSKPAIRGLAFNRVVVVEDGIKHEGQQWGADHGLEVDQFAIEHVQIIKGPASITYGSDAIGGVVELGHDHIPHKQSVSGMVDIMSHSHNQLRGTSVALNGRHEKWFFKTRFSMSDYGDYRVPTDRVSVYSYPVSLHNQQLRNTAGNEKSVMITTGYTSKHFTNRSMYSRNSHYSGFFANAHGREPRNVNEYEHDASSRDILNPSQEVVHHKVTNKSALYAGNWQIKSELGYQYNDRSEWSEYFPHGYMHPTAHQIAGIPQNLERKYDKYTYSGNLSTTWNAENHVLTGGIQAEKQRNSINGYSFIIPGFEQNMLGGYLYDKMTLSSKITLHAAIRANWGNIRINPYRDWFKTPVVENETVVDSVYAWRSTFLQKKYQQIVWSAGVVYNADALLLKLNVGKSFRMPSAKELAANGVNYHHFSYELGNSQLRPEVSYQADAMIEWNRSGWEIQFSPFLNYFPNYIYLNPSYRLDFLYGAGNQIFNYTQAEVLRHGGEIHAKGRINKWLKSSVVAEWVFATQTSGSKKGFTLPFSPPPSVIFNLKAEAKARKLFRNTVGGIDYCITAPQNRIVPPETKTPGYQIWNLIASTDIKMGQQWVVLSMQLKNVLDTRYMNHTSFYRLIELPEAGRAFYVNLHIPFVIIDQLKH
jgi:iron complex outermembrane recepter protein